MEINFYNEKFYLEDLDSFDPSIGIVSLSKELKKSLRYQLLFIIGNDLNLVSVVEMNGLKKKNLGVCSKDTTVWVIRKRNSVYKKKPLYDAYEQKVIKAFIKYFVKYKTEITEKLCSSLGDDILDRYYSSYGKENLNNFISDLTSDLKYHIENPFRKLTYGRSKYCVVDLLREFEKVDDLKIYTDPDLIGEYKRISVKRRDGSERVLDNWAPFIGIRGNRERANLSIRTRELVSVTIPKNKFGIPGELKLNSFRSFTIIADGKLNVRYLGIKTSNTKLTGKLKRLGVAESLLLKDEFLLDLSKLPLIRKSSISAFQIANAEYQVVKHTILRDYITLLEIKNRLKLVSLPIKSNELTSGIVMDEKTAFLEGLGIYGDCYYPELSKIKRTPERSYQVTIVEGKVVGIPNNLYPNIRTFINKGNSSNKIINDILKECISFRDIKDPDTLKNLLNIEKSNRSYWLSILRDCRFKLILGKTMILDKKGINIESRNYSLDKGIVIKWTLKDKKFYI